MTIIILSNQDEGLNARISKPNKRDPKKHL